MAMSTMPTAAESHASFRPQNGPRPRRTQA